MRWEFIAVLVIAIPLVLFPAVLIWYLSITGIYRAIQKAWKRQITPEGTAGIVMKVKQNVAEATAKEKPVQKATAENND